MTSGEAMADALAKHPDCEYADWDNGLNCWLQLTYVVKLWRNMDCYLAGDPPKYVIDGYERSRVNNRDVLDSTPM